MKAFFKNVAKTFVKGIIAGAQEDLGGTLSSEFEPMLAEETLFQSKMVLFNQMDSLLFSIKELLIKMKRSSTYTTNLSDDKDYQRMLTQLKDFSKSVEHAIKEIEAY